MKANDLIAGVGASRLANELFSLGGALAQTNINQTPPALANEQELSEKNCVLLLQNCLIMEQIAAKIGVEVSNNSEVKQQLICETRSILIGIAQKLGVLIPSLPNGGGSDLVTQNHLLLLGNRLIVWAIASSLRINIPVGEILHGNIFEQNYQLLLANQKILEAIALQLGATPAN